MDKQPHNKYAVKSSKTQIINCPEMYLKLRHVSTFVIYATSQKCVSVLFQLTLNDSFYLLTYIISISNHSIYCACVYSFKHTFLRCVH